MRQHIPSPRRISLLVLGLLMAVSVQAQQRQRYSQYLLNAYLTNPALTGVEPYWDLRAGIAQQWVGLPGAPRSIYFTGHRGLYPRTRIVEEPVLNSLPARGRGLTPPTTTVQRVEREYGPQEFPDFHLGVGGQIFSEQTGPITYNGVTGSFAAHIRLVGKLRMGLGTSMEMLNYRLNPAAIEMLTANDITLTQNRVSLLLPTLNAGIAFYSQRFFLTASTRQLMRSRIVTNPASPTISGLETHYFLQGGLKVKLSQHIGLLPSMALRMRAPAPPSLDMSLQSSYKDLFFVGFSYRHLDAVVFLAGVRFHPNMRCDYAYDYTTTVLRGFTSGSHSLVLSIYPGYGKYGGRRFFW